jgi:uncharacterized protein (UPF0147 family)
MDLSPEQQKGIKELVTLVHELCNNSNIPNNARRDLTDSGVRRLMPETMKTTAVRIEELIEQFGYDISTRIAVIEVCKAVGVNVNFVPTEQDSCGWLTAKFTTPKGCFHYG